MTESFTERKKEYGAIEKIGAFNKFGSVLGLERIKNLLERLGNPEKELKCIHVAGTNGKGSVARFIYSALLANGYSVGIYTSPFLTCFNERIEADGIYISDEDLELLADEVIIKANEMVAEGFDSPTEFDVITAIAFLYFLRKKCDYVILEVGLGGRGDSTNAIDKPLASIIASISYDHMDRLGNTLEEIAKDKAGIIKPGAPVISNVPVSQPETAGAAKVIAKEAYEKGAVLYDVSKIKYRITENSTDGIVFDTSIGETSYEGVPITMLGEHQVRNAMTALTAIEVLRKNGDIKVERSKLYKGFSDAVNIGRFEIIRKPEGTGSCEDGAESGLSKKPYIVLDGAHNGDGSAALLASMKTYFPGKKVLMVMGILADKDSKAILDNFCEIADDFIATEPESERRLKAESLAELLKLRGKKCKELPNINDAVKEALDTSEYDVILFAGSLYLIGKVRGLLNG